MKPCSTNWVKIKGAQSKISLHHPVVHEVLINNGKRTMMIRCILTELLACKVHEKCYGARSKFGGVAGSENFACATLPTTPLDFQSEIKNFCHPILLKIRFKITVTIPPTLVSGLQSLKLLLHMTISFIKENHFNNCIMRYTWRTKLQQN